MNTDVQPSRARTNVEPARRRFIRRFTRRGAYQDTKTLVVLMALALVIVVSIALFPEGVPLISLMVPLLLGSLLLNPRHLPWFVIYLLATLVVGLALQSTITGRTYGGVGVMVLMCLIVLSASMRRSRLGVAGTMGESMFVDLRDRILQQGGIPQLPAGWRAESALRSAGGTPFAGDFVVASLSTPSHLELAVVDASGEGAAAGTSAPL